MPHAELKSAMPGILGMALLDILDGKKVKTPLMVNCDRSSPEEMNIPMLFSEYAEWSKPEKMAVTQARGLVLDLGGGAGRHSLWLQDNGLEVEAIDSDWGCVETMRRRGVRKVAQEEWQWFKPLKQYDTIISLMNGAGLAGNEDNLNEFIRTLKTWLAPHGQILLDTSTVEYLPPSKDKSRRLTEVYFQFEYGALKGPWFSWLFAPYKTIIKAFEINEMRAELATGIDKTRALVRGYL